jgi:hypothetical protein
MLWAMILSIKIFDELPRETPNLKAVYRPKEFPHLSRDPGGPSILFDDCV